MIQTTIIEPQYSYNVLPMQFISDTNWAWIIMSCFLGSATIVLMCRIISFLYKINKCMDKYLGEDK